MEPEEEEKGSSRPYPKAAAASNKPVAAGDRVIMTVILAAMAGLGAFAAYNGAIRPPEPAMALIQESDAVSEQQARDRIRVFMASNPLQLRLVTPAEVPTALATMKLADAEMQRLVQALQSAEPVRSVPGATPVAMPPSPKLTTASASPAAVRLAWLTLWDTDAQDGDQVRIDSSGFSTMVTLANAPFTFAIPVPAEGVVNVTGAFDGGGGITIGALSGARQVSLPIMSIGQVLGIPVTVR